MDLATITCDRDFYLMDTQARSIQKFVAPCKHWIFVLESEKPQQEWIDYLSPYYTNHQVEFVFLPYTERLDPSGWTIQQYWKLRIVDWIKNDFVIIDSKNLFVKETDVSKWEYEGTGMFGYMPENMMSVDDPAYDPTTNGVIECRDYYADFYNLPKIRKHFTVLTPFLSRQNVMEDVAKLVKEKNVFAVKTGWNLDFIIYSMVALKYGLMEKDSAPAYRNAPNAYSILFHKTNWTGNDAYKDGYNIIASDKICKCFGLHHSWVNYAPMDERIVMRDYLDSLGILGDNLKNRLNEEPISNDGLTIK